MDGMSRIKNIQDWSATDKVIVGGGIFVASPFLMNALLYGLINAPVIGTLMLSIWRPFSGTYSAFYLFILALFLSFTPTWCFVWKANVDQMDRASIIGLLSLLGIPYGLFALSVCSCAFDHCFEIL